MKSIFFISIFLFSILQIGRCQYKLQDIPYRLSEINKRSEKGRQGVWFFYDRSDSTVFAMQHFVNDTLHGYFERYWQNGKVSERGYYKKGIVDSVFIGFWQNGKKRGEAFYANGLLSGIVISYNDEEKITSRLKYVNGVVDSSFEMSYLDSSIVWDNQARNKIDTIKTVFNADWNKRYAIYTNDTLSKELDFYKDRLTIESFYDKAVLMKRIIYSKTKPFRIEKVFYYKNGELTKTYLYDKNGKLIK